MEDIDIIDLYCLRDERAIAETGDKYGRYCTSIALRILRNSEDAEECVSDTWLSAWNQIPPDRPERLSVYLGRITRNIALRMRRDSSASKRGGGLPSLPFDELTECISDGKAIDEHIEAEELGKKLSEFISQMPAEDRVVFVRRYWYCDSIEDIAELYGLSKSAVKMKLKRARDRLRMRLEGQGYIV